MRALLSRRVQRDSRSRRTSASETKRSSRRSSTSPSGMVSIRLIAWPWACAHATRSGISRSFTPRIATVLSLTCKPASRAAAIPSSTCGSASRRERARKVSGSRVSSETLIRRTPARARFSAWLASCVPLVVSVTSSSSCPPRLRAWRPIARTRSMTSRRTSGSPPVRRIVRTPP